MEYILTILSVYLPIIIQCLCLLFKIAIISKVSTTKYFSSNKSFLYFIILMLTSIYVDLAYAIYSLSFTYISPIPPNYARGFLWLCFPSIAIHFHGLLLFFNTLSSNPLPKKYFYGLLPITISFLSYFVFEIRHIFISGSLNISSTSWTVIKWHSIYFIFLGLCSLILLHKNEQSEQISLLKKHISVLKKYFMLPYLFIRFIDSYFVHPAVNIEYTVILSVFLSYMFYYCSKKLALARFLNIQNHVESAKYQNFSFPKDFVNVIGTLGSTTKISELIPITKHFFEQGFDINKSKTHLLLKYSLENETIPCCKTELENIRHIKIDDTFNPNHPDLEAYLLKNKIIIRDEVEFTLFYEKNSNKVNNPVLEKIVHFMQEIKADIFLPVYSNGRFIASIVVDKNSRKSAELFTDVDRDEMLIYNNYISGVIYLLSHANLEKLLEDAHKSQSEIYKKGKILDLIKKSVFSFVDTPKSKKVGIITYKNKKFTYLNQDAKEILGIDLNRDKGLDLTTEISQIASDTTVFLTPTKKLILDGNNEPLMITSTPNLQRSNTLITVYKPSLSDLVKDKLTNLKDISKWEYILALTSTEEGRLVDQLLPSDSPTLLSCKITFFEKSISNKNVSLEMNSQEDALAFAQVAHKINKRSLFETVEIKKYDPNFGVKLFGKNSTYHKDHESGLLERLDTSGTIFIQNIHLLDMDLQKKLLEFMATGKFTPLNSNDHIHSDVFLVCATNQNILDLVQRGLFLKELYLELRENSVWLPAINTLPEEEFSSLVEGLREQIVSSKAYKNLLVFTKYDVKRLLARGCVSIYELKNKIKSLILAKTQRKAIDDENIVDPASAMPDLELAEAARLGKNTLKDPQLLTKLLVKFNGSQSKVASFLNVNRSSVSRRCEQYGIKLDKETI